MKEDGEFARRGMKGGAKLLTEDRKALAHAQTTVAQIETLLGVKSSATKRGRKAPATRGNPRVAKTKLVHVIQGHYGYGWEDLSEYEDTTEGRKLMRHDLKEYVASKTGPVRSIKRRVPIKTLSNPAHRRAAPHRMAQSSRPWRALFQKHGDQFTLADGTVVTIHGDLETDQGDAQFSFNVPRSVWEAKGEDRVMAALEKQMGPLSGVRLDLRTDPWRAFVMAHEGSTAQRTPATHRNPPDTASYSTYYQEPEGASEATRRSIRQLNKYTRMSPLAVVVDNCKHLRCSAQLFNAQGIPVGIVRANGTVQVDGAH